MNDEQKIMPPRRLAQVIRREAWLVGLVMLVAILAAAAITAVQTPMYRAKMTLVVGLAGGEFQPEIGSPTITQTITTLFESEVVASQVIDTLRLDTTPEKLGKKLKVLVRPNSAVVEVSVDADSTTEAERVLEQYAAVFRREIKRLGFRSENPAIAGGSTEPIIYATVFNPPRADPEAVSPRKGAAMFTAALLGLIIGLLLAFVRERLDDRIRSRQEAEEAFGAPVIGGLPAGSGRSVPYLSRPPTASSRQARRGDALAASLQMLSLNLELLDEGKGSSILVTSTQQEEGKTTLVANLGVALARAGHHVVCVEADPDAPNLSSLLGLSPLARNGASAASADLSLDQLLGRVDVKPYGRSTALAGDLRVMTFDDWQAGLAAHGPKDRGATLVRLLRAYADYVIFDASPLTMGDASRLALLSDSVLVVARSGRTTQTRAETTSMVLRRLGVSNVSVVLTEADADDLG